MATKIRLQRHGKKKQPFYHIVVADSRAPRDGRFIENIGYYDPIKVPAKISLDFQKALDWYSKGAQPTDTVRNILRHEGVLLRYHLQLGIAKGALTQEQADVKFNDWKQSKDNRAASKRNEMEQQERSDRKKQLESEKKTSEDRLAKINEKNLAILKEREAAARRAYAEEHPEETVEQPVVETDGNPSVTEEQPVEVVEEQPVEVVEEQPAEVVEEQPEVTEEPAVETDNNPSVTEEPAVETDGNPSEPVAEEEPVSES